jgi:glycogen(starch) synthase
MNRPLSIVHLAWEYPPLVVGGLGVHVAGLARAQAARGHEVWVLTAGSGRTGAAGAAPAGLASGARAGAGPHVRRVGPRPGPDGGPFLWQLDRLGALMVRAALADPALARPGRRRVVHAHDWLVAAPAIRLAAFWRAPLVATFHATEQGRHGPAALSADAYAAAVAGWEMRLSRAARVRIAPSASLAAEVAALGDGPVAVVPGGFDPGRRAPRRAPVPGRILAAARLVPEKGLDTLLTAVAMLTDRGVDAHLHVAGDGPLAAPLAGRLAALGLGGRVRLLGRLGAGALAEERARAWVFAAPSRYEPFGLAALEAVTDGVPLVASRVGGLAEWAVGVASLVEAGDGAALAHALAAALRAPARDVRREVRAALAHLAWGEVARAVEDLYRRALVA